MGLFEDLPPDQRAVLQMVLQRGRSYDEIASLLSIDRSAVRQRALDGFLYLTPDTVLPGPEQALVTDYLLRQLPDQVADQVYAYLEAAEADREWAIEIALQLAPLAGRPLPEIPDGYLAEPSEAEAEAEAAAPVQGAAEYHEPEAELSGRAPDTADDEYSWESPAAAISASEPAAPERSSEPAAAEPPSAADGGQRLEPKPRRARRIPLAAYAGALLVIIVIGIIVAVSGGSSPSPALTSTTKTHSTTDTSPATTATQTTTTTPPPQLLTALNLTSPTGATQTVGVAQVIREDGVVGVVISAQGVPANAAHNAYGVWLYNSPTSNEFVGFVPNLVGKNGKLATEGQLPSNAADYSHILVTLETQSHPKTPGEVVLSGPFREHS